MTTYPTDPYVGLRAYTEFDRDRFHGRSREIGEVVDLWLGSQLLVLFGSSGVGKSSLLNAGVLPALSVDYADTAAVLPVGRIAPGPPSATNLSNPYLETLLSTWFPDVEWVGQPLDVVLNQYVQQFDVGKAERRPLLCAIDQFEDLFTGGSRSRHHREDFIELLAEALEEVAGVHLLVSIGTEQIGDLMAVEDVLDALPHRRYRLLSLTPEDAIEAATRPLVGTGIEFAPDALTVLVERAKVATSTVLRGEIENREEPVDPMLLQVCCAAAWARRHADVIRVTDLLPEVDGHHVLRAYCAEIVAAAADAGDVPEGWVWEILSRTFITEIGTRRPVPVDELPDSDVPTAVVEVLLRRSLITSVAEDGQRWYEITHDRLVEPIRLGGRPWLRPSRLPAELLWEAEQALKAGDLPTAERRAAEAVDTSGDDSLVRAEGAFLRGVVAFRIGHHLEAETHLVLAVQQFSALGDPMSIGRVQAELGRLYLATDRVTQAIEELQAASQANPGDAAITINLARALRSAGERRASAAVLSAYLSAYRGEASALVERGLILVELHEYRSALADFADAIRFDPAAAARADVADALGVARRRAEGESL
ncbi:hypothetical protein [Cryptosporangium aurantiacum]|uniref:Novel STAND NTPase 1 domain-containing protein n=1 Tax=Cryptosporangium aurantiacum TaxID=134849 RepID=A0A1M7N836_9ACTN|nr:hypothetical protein SAMN05443668_102480 [Cryptosporangium aurantiacum]